MFASSITCQIVVMQHLFDYAGEKLDLREASTAAGLRMKMVRRVRFFHRLVVSSLATPSGFQPLPE